MKSKTRFFSSLIFLLTFLLTITVVNSVNIYNKQGDFSIETQDLNDKVYNDNIYSNLTFTINNQLNSVQTFFLDSPRISGWNVFIDKNNFSLKPGESSKITISYIANSNFDYLTNVVSPDVIEISQNEEYIGYFEFPVLIQGKNQNVSMKFSISIDKREKPQESFSIKMPTEKLSPISPLKYTITAENLNSISTAEIIVKIDDKELSRFNENFSPSNSYKIYSLNIPNTLSPNMYTAEIIVRLSEENSNSAKEWFERKTINVVEYKKLEVDTQEKTNFYMQRYDIIISNNGNTMQEYTTEIELSFISRLLFGSNNDYVKDGNKYSFSEELNINETKRISYFINYIPIYILLVIAVIILTYFYIRKTSNPLDVETKIYDVRKVEHEGVKSMKISIGVENIKAEKIDNMRIIFRMPVYLNIKDNSFTLTEPNHVLKGKTQYKLTWEFKNFEMEDSRIVGFTLVNSKGVLGDIRLPNLEVEVKVAGKIRRYYQSFKIIRG